MAEGALWTLEQLSDQVAEALAVDYDGQPSGRVREVPSGRTIRWYTTIGLVDRPAAMRGRTALYGHRHLLQLVAVKRLQAAGRPLAEVQQELFGRTDADLAKIAKVRTQKRQRFWAVAAATKDVDSVTSERLYGVRWNGVTVLTQRAPTVEELAAIDKAAAPLLELLDRLGLTERQTR